ncbi:threonine-type endopeptidase [Aureococcus anophagefferens]|uniref:Proteasome subunit beta n=1 Tax=Aureococcus anophagefferens TaxID=44056 RepID=A0ABR1GBF5_AURAN
MMGAARHLIALTLLLRQTRATTLAGVVFEHGVVLGADSRATTGSIIADSSCDKLHPLCGNCWAGGCGTAADADELTRHVALDIRLRGLRAATTAIAAPAAVDVATVDEARGLLRRRLKSSRLQCGFVLGGVDATGPKLYRVEPDGATASSKYAAMGSGQFGAIARIEAARHAPTASRDDAIGVVRCAIEAGIACDTGSGGEVHLVVIEPGDAGAVVATRLQFEARPPGR